MKVDIAVHGRFHAFRLAEQLNKYKLLRKLYTIYPKYRITPFGILKNHIKSYYLLGALVYSWSKLGIKFSNIGLSTIFDELVSKNIKPLEQDSWIFVGFNGSCEKSLIKAKMLGAITIVERGCPHIETQLDLINEEMQLLTGKSCITKMNMFHEKMIREYEICDYIVVPSSYSAKSFIEKGLSSKIKIIPLCNEKIIPYRKKTRTNGDFVVLFVGGNVYRKGLFYLLNAWNELKLPKSRLIIRSIIPKEFQYLVKGENISVIDHHISQNDLVRLYEQASIFCLPSIDEGFGMVVVEAMASGLPVIISENVGAKDLIKNGVEGFIVPIRDKEALKEKITFFYENPKITEEMGQAAYKKAIEYNPQNYGKRVVELYQELCATYFKK